jgi:hypothetical protein
MFLFNGHCCFYRLNWEMFVTFELGNICNLSVDAGGGTQWMVSELINAWMYFHWMADASFLLFS